MENTLSLQTVVMVNIVVTTVAAVSIGERGGDQVKEGSRDQITEDWTGR